MKRFKRIIAMTITLIMSMSFTACSEKAETTTEAVTEATTEAIPETTTEATVEEATLTDVPEDNKVELVMPEMDSEPIYVYSWDESVDEKLQYFRNLYPQYADLVQFVSLDLPKTSDEYKVAILQAIDNGGSESPSIIACDSEIARFFLESDITIPVADIGITDEMYKNAYPYTVDFATVDDKLKGMTWEATPGAFVYRTDIAEAVLGVSEPEEVQEYVKDWDTFFETAKLMSEAEYDMLSGCDDIKQVFLSQKSAPWVESESVIIDQSVKDYMQVANILYTSDYTDETELMDDGWNNNITGDVFGYFGSTWFVQDTINVDKDSETYGMRRVCAGPADYSWGGTYFGVTSKCSNKELAALVLYTICCDTDVMYNMSDETLDFVNNQESIKRLIDDGKGETPILGGQNPLGIWDTVAKNANGKYATEFDMVFGEFVDDAVYGLNTGQYVTVEDAVTYIKEQIKAYYPDFSVE